jgi:hypothetical protein
MAYCVLVAGEHWKLTTGERNMGTNHCSLEHVGEAYDSLRENGVPRGRIIVVAQIEEARAWLRAAVTTGEPSCCSVQGEEGRQRSRQIYASKLSELERRCGRIIAEGGADYDGEQVNPGTVVEILTAGLPGLAAAPPVQTERTEQRSNVPAGAGILLAIYSHGCSHETAAGGHYQRLIASVPCDVCNLPHDVTPASAAAAAAGGVISQPPDGAVASAQDEPYDHEHSGYDHEHISFKTNEW